MSELGEPVFVGMVQTPEDPGDKPEKCKRIYIHAFRGDRSPSGMGEFQAKLEAGKAGTGPGPTGTDCLLYTGHVGISFDADSPIYGFNPNTGTEPSWQVIENLKDKKTSRPPYPGIVTDDTSVFSAAKSRNLPVIKVELVYPESRYNEIKQRFDAERARSEYFYSFPGRGGDCNCATWPGRIGIAIPEGSGIMSKYVEAASSAESPRKLGLCEE